jgi:hypothetical protein
MNLRPESCYNKMTETQVDSAARWDSTSEVESNKSAVVVVLG